MSKTSMFLASVGFSLILLLLKIFLYPEIPLIAVFIPLIIFFGLVLFLLVFGAFLLAKLLSAGISIANSKNISEKASKTDVKGKSKTTKKV